jgi:adenylosuccinate synthase
MSVKVIIGAQWGDEGKGKIVDSLSENVDIVVRYQGGANAGHTVFIDEKKYILHLIPGGILRPGIQCVIGNGVVFDPQAFFEEVAFLSDNAINIKGRLMISDRAHVIFPYHKLLDQLSEKALNKNKIGTTGRGIGPAYVDKINRSGIRIVDLFNRKKLEELLELNLDVINRKLRDVYHEPLYKLSDLLEQTLADAKGLESFVGETTTYLYNAWKNGKSLILEGAQGSLLDIDFGSYPYVTSSNPTIGGAISGSGLPLQAVTEIIGVIKAYTTRVGEGPFPTEEIDKSGEILRKTGGEYGATTGRARRCGWFDGVAARYTGRINGFTSYALTKLDVLDQFEKIQICTQYIVKGKKLDYFPSSTEQLKNCKPVYETMKGWQSPTDNCRKYEDLPLLARIYVERLEKLLDVPITHISVGVDRKQIIFR